MAAEFGKPQWTFSMVSYAFVSPTRVAATYTQNGRWKLAMIDVYTKRFEAVDLSVQPLESIKANGDTIYFVGGSSTESPANVMRLRGGHTSTCSEDPPPNTLPESGSLFRKRSPSR